MSFVVKCFDAETGHVEPVSGEFPDFTSEPVARAKRRAEKVEEFAAYDTNTSNTYFSADVDATDRVS